MVCFFKETACESHLSHTDFQPSPSSVCTGVVLLNRTLFRSQGFKKYASFSKQSKCPILPTISLYGEIVTMYYYVKKASTKDVTILPFWEIKYVCYFLCVSNETRIDFLPSSCLYVFLVHSHPWACIIEKHDNTFQTCVTGHGQSPQRPSLVLIDVCLPGAASETAALHHVCLWTEVTLCPKRVQKATEAKQVTFSPVESQLCGRRICLAPNHPLGLWSERVCLVFVQIKLPIEKTGYPPLQPVDFSP